MRSGIGIFGSVLPALGPLLFLTLGKSHHILWESLLGFGWNVFNIQINLRTDWFTLLRFPIYKQEPFPHLFGSLFRSFKSVLIFDTQALAGDVFLGRRSQTILGFLHYHYLCWCEFVCSIPVLLGPAGRGDGKTSGVRGASFVSHQTAQEMFPHFLVNTDALCRFSVDILHWLRIFPFTWSLRS